MRRECEYSIRLAGAKCSGSLQRVAVTEKLTDLWLMSQQRPPPALLPHCMWTWVWAPWGFIDGHSGVLSPRQVPFVMRKVVVGPEAKLKIEIICSLHFPLTDTNWKQTISKCTPAAPSHFPLCLSQSNKPCAPFSGGMGGWGVGKLGWAVWRERRGAIEREGEPFSLPEYGQTSLFLPALCPVFPFLPHYTLCEWGCLGNDGERKKHPSPPSQKKRRERERERKKERFGTWDEDWIHVCRESISAGIPGWFLGWREK